MEKIRLISLSLFNIKKQIKCKCSGLHEICLDCEKCHIVNGIQTVSDFNNLNTYIDHTSLRPDTTNADIIRLNNEALIYKFKSICINPTNVKYAISLESKTKVCSVIGFPLGANTWRTKMYEAKECIELGASELDIVIDIGAFKAKEYLKIFNDLKILKKYCENRKVVLKAIIESCLLSEDEIIIISLIVKKAGFDFVKTSTGFGIKGAEFDTVRLIRDTLGPYMGVKASGGIKNRHELIKMLQAGANRIGTSNSVNIMEETPFEFS